MIRSNIIKYLSCPHCQAEMEISNDLQSLFCRGEKRHCFDFSSKGYVNLNCGKANTGDSKQAVRSRTEFLNKGYYTPIAQKLTEIIKRYKPSGFLIDAGCGEGFYTEKILSAGYVTAGVDLSKFAVAFTASRMKCKTNENAFSCVASVFELPFKSGSADVIISVFAPCAEEEAYRVLSDDGILVIASAGKNHLLGLKKAIYDNLYVNDIRADIPENMELCARESLCYTIDLENNEDIQNLFSMTPYYWRTSPKDAEKLAGLDSLNTEIDISFYIFKKRH